jgi:hypothetical protein
MFIYTLLTSLLFFSTPSISYENDDPYYSDVEYCDIYQYCDNPELDPEWIEFNWDDISKYLDEDFDGGDVEWEIIEEESDLEGSMLDILFV